MFKNIRLSYKISLGFAAILFLAIALGTVALWNMNRVEQLSVKLDTSTYPKSPLQTTWSVIHWKPCSKCGDTA